MGVRATAGRCGCMLGGGSERVLGLYIRVARVGGAGDFTFSKLIICRSPNRE